MECNKEEAIRAKGIAENKMQGKDFVGARKIVLKAQQLFPDLENVSQMLTVCEVHCSSGIKVNGETDWYGILQVEPTADEITIKKQYRKLALLLHPDKNKFAGAESAFKLVGEAHRTLSDQAKRSLHDIKRVANFITVSLRQPTQQSNKPSGTRRQPGVSNAANKSSTQFNGSSQQQPSEFSSTQTFWTICPFCGIRYQYFQSILNRALRCQSCMKPFIAYDLNVQAVPSGANSGCSWNPTGVPQQEFQGPGAHSACQKSHFGNASSGIGFQGNVGGGSTSSQPWSKSGFNTEIGDGSENKAMDDCKVNHEVQPGNEVKFETVKLQEVNKREQVVKPSVGTARQKRGRKVVGQSSDSEGKDTDAVIEKHSHPSGHNVGTTGSNPRRSTRQKQNISYNEDGVDYDDSASPSVKRSRKGGSYNANPNDKASSEGYSNGVDERADREEILNNTASPKANPCVSSSQKASTDLDTLSYPDPEFFDFEKERDASKFAVDQIWAVYDNLDGMPRFYVRIRNVYGPDFKILFTWLEHDPIGKAEMEWSEEDLPVACGNFRLGKSERTKEKLMFSHLMTWRKGKKRYSYEMHPRKGEVWALFKDWNIGWSADADNHRDCEYEVVEVLSDYAEGAGISVVHLVKVNGFVSLFVQAVDKGLVPLQIPPSDILRFSHRVPSYRMSGEEREGIPAGSFELDSASLPSNFSESFPSISLENCKARVKNLDNVSDGLHFKSGGEEKPTAGTTTANSFQSNEKNAHEKQKSSDPSANGLNGACEKEHIRACGAQHSASEAGEHVETETVTPKCQIHTENENFDAREPSTNNAAEQDNASPTSSRTPIYEYPDPEFYNFEEARSSDKFECGQIWALYSDIDRYPNYYGRIRKVDSGDFKVHVAWLQAYTVRKEEKHWLKELPVSCGKFKIINETSIFDTTDTFSHLVQAVPAGRRDHYAIYPNAGEVWALYKNWSLEWSRSGLEGCEYDVVEILACSDSGIKVLGLAKVDGYRSVFMPERQGPAASTLEIPMAEYLRFSHQIPAFRLTEERGGKLRGFWELDPASVPEILLFTDSY